MPGLDTARADPRFCLGDYAAHPKLETEPAIRAARSHPGESYAPRSPIDESSCSIHALGSPCRGPRTGCRAERHSNPVTGGGGTCYDSSCGSHWRRVRKVDATYDDRSAAAGFPARASREILGRQPGLLGLYHFQGRNKGRPSPLRDGVTADDRLERVRDVGTDD